MIKVSRAVVSLRMAGLSPTSQVPDLLAHGAAFGWLEVREGAADEREEIRECLGREGREPGIEGAPEAGLME